MPHSVWIEEAIAKTKAKTQAERDTLRAERDTAVDYYRVVKAERDEARRERDAALACLKMHCKACGDRLTPVPKEASNA